MTRSMQVLRQKDLMRAIVLLCALLSVSIAEAHERPSPFIAPAVDAIDRHSSTAIHNTLGPVVSRHWNATSVLKSAPAELDEQAANEPSPSLNETLDWIKSYLDTDRVDSVGAHV